MDIVKTKLVFAATVTILCGCHAANDSTALFASASVIDIGFSMNDVKTSQSKFDLTKSSNDDINPTAGDRA